jgi:hypothetical protein
LNRITKSVVYVAKIPICHTLHKYIRAKYGLKFRLVECSEFLDDFRILRANFKNDRDVSKILSGSFKVGVRESRKVIYRSFVNGKLTNKYLTPRPNLVISFLRDDQVFEF